MTAKIIPIIALLLPLLSKSYNQSIFMRRKQLWEPGLNPLAHRIGGGCFHMRDNRYAVEIEYDLDGVEIPESFDARVHWANCPSIGDINNQADCGSCWAFGAVEVMTDRICIHSNGTIQFQFSADDLISCCKYCGGCNGAKRISDPYEYWVTHGIVSGGDYGSGKGCRPYEIHPLLQYYQYLSYGNYKITETPKCVKKCEKSYGIPYKQDLRFGKKHYGVAGETKNIQAEIMLRGPVSAGFIVHEDFQHHYTGKGIYHYSYGKKVGKHVVKLIGWGVENEIDYWIVANSYGTGYGDDGFFKFIRGINNCGIEDEVWAGIPAL